MCGEMGVGGRVVLRVGGEGCVGMGGWVWGGWGVMVGGGVGGGVVGGGGVAEVVSKDGGCVLTGRSPNNHLAPAHPAHTRMPKTLASVGLHPRMDVSSRPQRIAGIRSRSIDLIHYKIRLDLYKTNSQCFYWLTGWHYLFRGNTSAVSKASKIDRPRRPAAQSAHHATAAAMPRAYVDRGLGAVPARCR